MNTDFPSTLTLGFAGMLLLVLEGCVIVHNPGSTVAGQVIHLQGTALYRERIALPPGAVLQVTIEDASRADAPADVLARTAVPARGAPPFRFALDYPAAAVQAGRSYAIRARIESEGKLLFITDARYGLPPPGSARPLELRLVRVRSPPAASAQLENTYWKLLRLGDVEVTVAERQREPHLILQAPPDGPKRVAGFSGCNRLMGSYELDGSRLRFGQLAGTLMACAEGMDTEKAFHQALQQVARWSIRGEQLELSDASGRRVALLESRYLD